MQRLSYILLLVVASTTTSLAQIGDQNDVLVKEPSQEIWKGNKNVFDDNSANMKTPGRQTPTINAPIDGGLVVLLSAGALYGGRQLKRRRTNKSK